MKTKGEQIADAIRDHLATNGLRQSQLTGAVVAEIADRVLDHLEKLAQKKARMATEEEWIKHLETEPYLSGVNIRAELAGCQFWCKNNRKLCTRKRFENWLIRAKQDVIVSPGGAKEQPKNYGDGPKGWLKKLNELFPDSVYAFGGVSEIEAETEYNWRKLDRAVQRPIRDALAKEGEDLIL